MYGVPRIPSSLSDLDIATDRLRAAYDHWDALRGARAMPSRADLDPSAIPHLLPNIILFAVEHAPLDFIYRVVGTEVERHIASRLTGQRMSEIPYQRPPSTIWSRLQRVAENGQPAAHKVPYVGPHRDFKEAWDVVLPFSADDRIVSALLVLVDFRPIVRR